MAEETDKPTLFGKYELLDRLAVGGMAEIFLARSASFGGVMRTCVIKRILPSHCANRQFVSMFIDEARIMIGLDHGNIVKMLDFGQIAGAYFMAMEYINGFDLVAVLRKLFTEGRTVDPLPVAYMIRAMASALHHAHHMTDHMGRQLEVVHRDISPHNVLLSYLGDVKLTDFGIAIAKNKLTHTVPGTVMGKFAYMAPEQALAEPVDARSDLFSVGVVMHEMLAGQRLFSAETPMLTITKVVESDIEPPKRFNSAVPDLLDDVTMTLLKRDPAQRYQSGDDLAAPLAAYLEEQGFGQADFADYLNGLEIHDDRDRIRTKHRTPTVEIVIDDGEDSDDKLLELKRSLASDPNVWTLVAIGERLLELDERVRGLATIRTAAAVFAFRGFLVQAIIALESIRHLSNEQERTADLLTLADLRNGNREGLRQMVRSYDDGEAFDLLSAADRSGLGNVEGSATVLPAPPPLLGFVDPGVFVQLVESAAVRTYQVGEKVIREGDLGDSLYAVGRGRVVVFCNPPEGEEANSDDGRIYLSSLSEGDFFGEFGFLTGNPRSATVEAISDAWVFELQRATIDALVDLTPEVAGALLDFYKERVAELLMAKSPVFAVLEPHQRKILLAHSLLETFDDNEMIVTEGELSYAFYFIKRGEVEVFTERDGMPIFLNKLIEGDFFGEISAIRGVPRTANVRSIGDVELLRIDAADIRSLIADEPRVAQAFERAIEERSEESAQLISEGLEILSRL